MKYLLDVIRGFFIGAGAILPGISSGVICIAFGIYEKLIDSVLGLFTSFKKNFTFILPYFCGAIINTSKLSITPLSTNDFPLSS